MAAGRKIKIKIYGERKRDENYIKRGKGLKMHLFGLITQINFAVGVFLRAALSPASHKHKKLPKGRGGGMIAMHKI